MGLFGRIRESLSRTKQQIVDRFDEIVRQADQPERRSRPIDVDTIGALEELLISADIGVAATDRIIEAVRKRSSSGEGLRDLVKHELRDVFAAVDGPIVDTSAPRITLIVGVNGTGKTTTIGKLAQRIKGEGNDVLICAADTFRAAATDQLAIWAARADVPLIQQRQGTDPAAVLFDALKAASARNSDVLIVDTAGRLHNKANLMAELDKMKRVASREVKGAPHETLLVIDAVTGQNGLSQAREFLRTANVTGLVLTKLDGTAKGGIAVAIAKELNLPIRYCGIGEKADDLVVFDPKTYVDGLFD